MKTFELILFVILMLAISFGFSSLLAYGLCWCFGFHFSIKMGLGVWLILTLLGAIIDDIDKRKRY